MININIFMEDGKINISAEGHANYAEHGKDIVCSAISAIVQTTVMGLQAVADQYPEHVKVSVKR